MNRKERRAARKQGSASIAELFDAAVGLHQAGQLADADRLYRQILSAAPDHIDSLHYRGVLAHQVGRNDVAVDLIGQAIALDDRIPECHYNIGLAFRALGRLPEVIAHNARAIALQPDYAEAHMNLGNALLEQGRLDEALDSYRRVLALQPDAAEPHDNIGNVLAAQGRLDEAVASYERALALKPDFAQAHNNLGTALMAQGKWEEAVARHERALTLNPGLAEAAINLGNALLAQGRLDDAISRYRQAAAVRPDSADAHNNVGFVLMIQGRLAEAHARYQQALTLNPDLVPALNNLAKLFLLQGSPAQALTIVRRALALAETEKTRQLFVESVKNLRSLPPGDDLRDYLVRALSEPWGRPSDLATVATAVVRADGIIASSDPAVLAGHRVLRALLESAPVCDVELERCLTAARAALLALAMQEETSSQTVLELACALARQCFINEYVFAHTDEEFARALRLRDKLLVEPNSETAPLRLAVVACYLPLQSLPASLLEASWPDAIAALLVQQVREPAQEREIRATIPRLTPIEDEVSLAVQQQYEENPYPRWVKIAPVGTPIRVDSYLHGTFPLSSFRPLGKSGVDILVAGCGTGQQSIEAAQDFAGARVLAIDLSRASLAYAKRKTDELGLQNIEYAQADLLALGSLGQKFDLIEAVGSLQATAAPMVGWRVLLSLLRPGGFMRLGLYSELARGSVVAARTFIAERGYGTGAEDIRRCRQELLGSADESLRQVAEFWNFFTVSECRDLLFHVQEIRSTLPEIVGFLAENDLDFLGFELDPFVLRQYAQRFPDDKSMTDLAHWHVFETENPKTFMGMYQFWVQKR